MNLDELEAILSTYKEKRIPLSMKDYRLLKTSAARPFDSRLSRTAQRRIRVRVIKKKLFGSEFETPLAMTGEWKIGIRGTHEMRAGLGADQAHVLQVQRSGGGKSCTNMYWAINLTDHAQGMLIVDLAKKEYRALVPRFAARGKRLYVCNHVQLPINPLVTPHPRVPQEQWDNIFVDFAALALRLPPPSRNELRICVRDLRDRAGSGRASAEATNMYHLMERVSRIEGRTAQRNAMLNRLQALVAELGPESLGQSRVVSVPEIFRRYLCLELHQLSYFSQNFMAAYLLAALFAYRMACPENREGLVVVFLDEALRIFSDRTEGDSTDGPAYLSTAATLVRGADVKLIVSVQTMHGLGRAIVANSSLKLMGPLGDHRDWDRLGKCMNMTPAQIAECKKVLRPGHYAVHISGGGYREPFLMDVPVPELPPPISDETAWQSGEDLRRELLISGGTTSHIQPLAQTTPEDVLTDEEKSYLKMLRQKPCLPSTEYARLLGMSNRKAARVRRSLRDKGFLREWRVELGTRGAKTVLLEPLDGPGDETENESHPGRKGNFVHQLGVRLVMAVQNADDYDTEQEKAFCIDDKTVALDIFGLHRTTGATIGIEVETDAKRGFHSLRKAILLGVDQIVIVAESRRVRDEIRTRAQEELGAASLNNVTFATIADYWNRQPDGSNG